MRRPYTCASFFSSSCGSKAGRGARQARGVAAAPRRARLRRRRRRALARRARAITNWTHLRVRLHGGAAGERGAGYIYVLAVVAGSDAGEARRGAVVFFNLRADYLPAGEGEAAPVAEAGGEAGQEAEGEGTLAATDGSHSMLSWRLGQ